MVGFEENFKWKMVEMPVNKFLCTLQFSFGDRQKRSNLLSPMYGGLDLCILKPLIDRQGLVVCDVQV